MAGALDKPQEVFLNCWNNLVRPETSPGVDFFVLAAHREYQLRRDDAIHELLRAMAKEWKDSR